MTISADFIDTILRTPLEALAYNIHRDLTQQTSRYVIQGSDDLFDIVPFAAAQHCIVKVADHVHAHSAFRWETGNTRADRGAYFRRDQGGDEKKLNAATSGGRDVDSLVEDPKNGWWAVEWEGHELDVVFVTVPRLMNCDLHLYHVITDERAIGERFVATVERFNAEVKEAIWVFEMGEWKSSKELYKAIKTATFDNLILGSDIKATIKTDLELFFGSREMYAEYEIPWKRGFLLSGPPGNGKTHLVKAMINHFTVAHPDISVLYVKAFKARYQPDEYAISKVFKRARNRPSILIFEDLDTMLTTENRAFFLNEVDGLAENTGIVLLATTNHPEALDTAIRDRPSRFDRRFEFALPGADERLQYMTMWNNKSTTQKDLHIPADVAKELCADDVTGGFSFAYLKELMLASMVRWVDAKSTKPRFRDVLMEQAVVLKEYIARTKELDEKNEKKQEKNTADISR